MLQRIDGLAAHAKIRALLGPDRKLERPLHAFTLNPPDAAVVDVVVHQASGLLVLEFDPRREAAPDNSLALVQSMIRGAKMVVRGTSWRGTKTTDTYSLKGFTAAYNKITETCR